MQAGSEVACAIVPPFAAPVAWISTGAQVPADAELTDVNSATANAIAPTIECEYMAGVLCNGPKKPPYANSRVSERSVTRRRSSW